MVRRACDRGSTFFVNVCMSDWLSPLRTIPLEYHKSSSSSALTSYDIFREIPTAVNVDVGTVQRVARFELSLKQFFG